MKIPVIATKQVPKAFGDISKVITQATHDGRKVFSKTQFSMLDANVTKHLESFENVTDVVLYGAETHICVK